MAKRKPKGPDAPEILQAEVFYRSPMYKDSHCVWLTGQTVALCGRELDFDPLWYIDSGWEEELGVELYLVEDVRKSGKCSQCRRFLKERKEEQAFIDGLRAPRVQDDPYGDARIRTNVVHALRYEEIQARQRVAWIVREFDGEVVSQ